MNLRSIIYCCTLAATAIGTSALAAPATFKVGAFTFSRPTSWEWVESTSTLRKAELRVPGSGGQSGEVIFFQFGPGQGGSPQANVDRWLGQFQEPREQLGVKNEKTTVGKWSVTYVHAKGTYLSGNPGGPKTALPGHALVGAIIESPDGNIFVRLTGPAALVQGATAEFKQMVASGLR